MPTRITFGDGTLDTLAKSPAVQEAKRIGLFVGASSLKKAGHLDRILALLAGKEVHTFENVSPEPEVADLERDVQRFRELLCDCIVAAGGGSVVDLAKGVAFCATQKNDVRGILTSTPKDAAPSVPVVAIPTTAGTGAEVTPFAVFWEKGPKKKHSLAHDHVGPAEAIVDPMLTHSMPPYVTATTGTDAFTQACEAYWNNNHNPLSDDYALMAIRRMFPALPRAVQNGDDAEARFDMMLGSLQAGLGFSQTRTAACHSISYPMTLHWNVAHGQAVGVTLPEVLKLNASAMPHRAQRFCDTLDVQSIDEAAENIRQMLENSGLKTRLSDLGIATDADLDLIVAGGFTPGRMGNNPYAFDAQSMKEMLKRIV